MNNKILVIVNIPRIDKEYDIMIPTLKKVGTVKNLIINAIKEDSDCTFLNAQTTFLYIKKTGEKLDDNEYIKHCKIENGSKLILF